MKKFKTLLLWLLYLGIFNVIAFAYGLVAGLNPYVNLDSIEQQANGLAIIYFLVLYGYLGTKVKYRWRDTFFQLIPIYGFFWQFRICYRTIERWSDQVTY